MNQPLINICPLLSIAGSSMTACVKENCALWDFGRIECVLFSIVDVIEETGQ